jgi:glycosyltransferase involved in cell wall biosynthesis
VLYAHDGPLLTSDHKQYYGMHINDRIRQRYLSLGDHVTFMMRVRQRSSEEILKFAPIKQEYFSVVNVPDFKSLTGYLTKRGQAKKIIAAAVKEHEVIVARLPSAIGTLAVRYALRHKKPLLVEYVACTFDAYWNYNWKGKLIAYFKMWEQQRIMRHVPYVIYVTNNFLQSRYPTKGKHIACSDVELQPLEEQVLDQRLEILKAWDGKRPLVMTTLAALDVPYKGQCDVVEAIALLKRKSILFKYKIVGKGDSASLKLLVRKLDVEDLVEIVGPLSHDKVFELLKNIDLYIQPSKQEGLPRALVEAMSMACPALGSRLAGIPELIANRMTFTPGSVKQIEEKLCGLTKDILIEEARTNFEEVKKYQQHLLSKRRKDFYTLFLNEQGLRTGFS